MSSQTELAGSVQTDRAIPSSPKPPCINTVPYRCPLPPPRSPCSASVACLWLLSIHSDGPPKPQPSGQPDSTALLRLILNHPKAATQELETTRKCKLAFLMNNNPEALACFLLLRVHPQSHTLPHRRVLQWADPGPGGRSGPKALQPLIPASLTLTCLDKAQSHLYLGLAHPSKSLSHSRAEGGILPNLLSGLRPVLAPQQQGAVSSRITSPGPAPLPGTYKVLRICS